MAIKHDLKEGLPPQLPLVLQATVFFYSSNWQQVAADMGSRIAGGSGASR